MVYLIGSTNLKSKNNELVFILNYFMKKSCFGKKICSLNFLCDVTDFHVHKKQKITDISQNQNDSYINFWFSKSRCNGACLWQFCCLQHVSIKFCRGGNGEGVGFPTVLWNLKTINANEKGKLNKTVSETF